MTMKLTKTDTGWILSLMRRRGRGKIVSVESKALSTADGAALVTAAAELEAAYNARRDSGRS